jgi:hypothetical protein
MERIWIDTESGTWGDARNLAFTDNNFDLEGMSDSEISSVGQTYGQTLEQVIDNAREEGYEAAADAVCIDCEEYANMLSALHDSVRNLLIQCDVSGGNVCPACDLTGLHASWCPAVVVYETGWEL